MFKEITEKDYHAEIEQSKGSYVLVFHALWCPPCKMFKSSLEELAEKDGINVYRVEIEANPELTKEFKVASLPTWFIVKDGQVVKQQTGFLPYQALSAEVKKYL